MALAAGLACLLAACDPPGKPKEHDPQAENREAIMDFPTLFESNCAGCHGADGKNGAARILNDSLYLAYIGKDKLRDVVRNGRPGTQMPAWAKSQGGPLTDKQVEALINGIYSHWATATTYPAMPPYATTATGDVNHGKRLFLMECFMCHGKGAAVGMVTDPQYVSLVSDEYIRSAIVAGRKDLGMPDYRVLGRGKPLSDQDLTDLVAFVSSYRPADAATARANDTGNGQNGAMTKGNEGSGNGPGSPRPQQRNEGNKGQGSSSQRGVK
jgi:cytochrome c oxidase cbb3-type subunit 3/ubiquinol-cytochrome c reductase cytochrome c subunit